MRWRVGILAALTSLALEAPAHAQGGRVGVVTTLEGQASVARSGAAQPVALRLRDDVMLRDRIATAANSLVRVLLGGKATVTARELSVLTITEDVGRSHVGLDAGRAGFSVNRDRMARGEVFEVHTPNAIAAVRGTVLIVEVEPATTPGGDATTQVSVLTGVVEVMARAGAGSAVVRVHALESVRVVGGTIGAVQPIPPASAAAMTAQYGAVAPPPGPPLRTAPSTGPGLAAPLPPAPPTMPSSPPSSR
jgi:hypothetical protein